MKHPVTRRDFIKTSALATGAVWIGIAGLLLHLSGEWIVHGTRLKKLTAWAVRLALEVYLSPLAAF